MKLQESDLGCYILVLEKAFEQYKDNKQLVQLTLFLHINFF